MNIEDQNTLTEKWHFETNCLNEKIDDAFKKAQDDAYEIGMKRGRAEVVDILVAITHHPGALEEQRERWEPIVVEELQNRMKQYESV